MAELTVGSPDVSAPRVIRPTKHRLKLRDVWTTREVARVIGSRDIKAKYKQAALGPIWLVLGPLGMLVAVTIAFSGVTSVNTGGIPYLIFALVGLCVWTYIQNSLTISITAIFTNAQLVRRSALPRLALVTGTLLGNLPALGVILTITVLATAIDRGFPVQALLAPLLFLWLVAFTWALSLIVSATAARFRDIISVMPLFIQAGIFVAPVGYPLQGAPKNIGVILALNPVSGLIEAWRWCLLDLPHPHVGVIAIAGGWTVALLVLGWQIFGRLEVNFADVV